MKHFHLAILFLGISSAFFWPGWAWADEVVMKSGERFPTTNVWEEGNKIRFNMKGLVVSVDKEEVAAIVKSAAAPGPESFQSPADPARAEDLESSGSRSTATPTARPGNRSSFDGSRSKQWHQPPTDDGKGTKGIGLDQIFWRMSPKQLPGLKKVETDPAFGGIDQYYRPDQPLKFAGAPLDGLVYGFWQGQLYSVMMWADGRIGYDRLRRGIFSTYGRGTQLKPEVERYVWDEPSTQRMLEFDEQLKTGIFIMRSSELDAVIKQRYPSTASR